MQIFSWSYGILLYELFSLGEVPYATIENGHLLDFLESGERLQKPSYCPDEMWVFDSFYAWESLSFGSIF